MAAICVCGVLGAGLAVVAARRSGAALAQAVGVQAAYVCALAVLLWRMSAVLRSALTPQQPPTGVLAAPHHRHAHTQSSCPLVRSTPVATGRGAGRCADSGSKLSEASEAALRDLDATRERLRGSKEQLSALRMQQHLTQREMAVLRSQVDALQSKDSTPEGESGARVAALVRSAEARLQGLQEGVRAAEAAAATHAAKLSALHKRVAAGGPGVLAADVKDASARVAGLQAQHSAVAGDVAALRSDVQRLESAHQAGMAAAMASMQTALGVADAASGDGDAPQLDALRERIAAVAAAAARVAPLQRELCSAHGAAAHLLTLSSSLAQHRDAAQVLLR